MSYRLIIHATPNSLDWHCTCPKAGPPLARAMLVDTLSPAPADLGDRLDAIAEETPAFADALRTMLWVAYTEAGRPLGPEEDAMLAWWGFGQGTTVQ